MSKLDMTLDELKFKGTISKMGTKRQIIIPVALYPTIQEEGFENVKVDIIVKKIKPEPKK